jgi:hypothetical protein
MSNETARRIRGLAEATLVDAAWAHWTVLTGAAIRADRRRAWTIVDPEALVLASLSVGHRERRLDDLVASWATDAAHLMSMHRMRTLASRFSPAVRERLGTFTRPAIAGGDKRWKRMGAAYVTNEYTPRMKPIGELRLMEGPALTLRLRAGFGVNAKADLLSLLIGLGGIAADLKVIAAATAYTERAIRTATEEMSLAGFIHEIHGRPSSFYAEPEAWARLLQVYRIDGDRPPAEPALPPWRFWVAVFAFLARVVEWSDSADSEAWTTYVARSRARDILDSCRRQLRQAQVRLPSSSTARGADFLRDFEDLVHEAGTWTSRGLYGSE